MFWAAVLSASAILLPALCPAADMDGLIAEGAALYKRACKQCHGETGDGLFYANIIPIAGIHHRYSPDGISKVAGSFSSRALNGPEREPLLAFLATLPGDKGFTDAGWLATPYFVEKKAPRRSEVRILDTRPRAAYDAGHIPNAIHVETAPCIEDATVTALWMRDRQIAPGTLVLIAGDQTDPEAACVWWKLRRAGHRWVEVVDGGMQRYAAEKRFATGSITSPVESTPSPAAWPWHEAIDTTGIRPQSELLPLLAAHQLVLNQPLPWQGSEPVLAHLAFTLSLTGQTLHYAPSIATITIQRADSPATR